MWHWTALFYLLICSFNPRSIIISLGGSSLKCQSHTTAALFKTHTCASLVFVWQITLLSAHPLYTHTHTELSRHLNANATILGWQPGGVSIVTTELDNGSEGRIFLPVRMKSLWMSLITQPSQMIKRCTYMRPWMTSGASVSSKYVSKIHLCAFKV